MEIKIDTTLMQVMSGKALLAKESVEDAMKSAEVITVHDDWNCAERDMINECIKTIKKNNAITCENMILYSSKINSLANQLDEFDRSLLSQFSGVDSSVGELFRVSSPVATGDISFKTINSEDLQRLSLRLGENTYWNQYHLSNMNNQISVVKFSDATNILSGSNDSISQTDLMKEMAADLGLDDIIGG